MRDIGSKAMDFGLQMMGVVEKHYPVSQKRCPLFELSSETLPGMLDCRDDS
jgi:hypothetical protein